MPNAKTIQKLGLIAHVRQLQEELSRRSVARAKAKEQKRSDAHQKAVSAMECAHENAMIFIGSDNFSPELMGQFMKKLGDKEDEMASSMTELSEAEKNVEHETMRLRYAMAALEGARVLKRKKMKAHSRKKEEHRMSSLEHIVIKRRHHE